MTSPLPLSRGEGYVRFYKYDFDLMARAGLHTRSHRLFCQYWFSYDIWVEPVIGFIVQQLPK
ncbi:MAG: hypothetical protein ACK51D_11165, partial [Cyclobacteriaceae bacterium]